MAVFTPTRLYAGTMGVDRGANLPQMVAQVCYTVPAGKQCILTEVDIANGTSSDLEVSIKCGTAFLAKGAIIGVGDLPVQWNGHMVLEAGDVIAVGFHFASPQTAPTIILAGQVG